MQNTPFSYPADFSYSRVPASTSYRNITLSSIGPWAWFVLDFAIAVTCAFIAFSLTPYSSGIEEEFSKSGHVSRVAFSIGAGFLVALVAHILGLHESRQARTSLKLLGRCALASGLALLILNLELLMVHYLVVGRLITVYAVIGCTIGLFLNRALVVGLVVRNQYVVGFVGSRKFIESVPNFTDLNNERGLKTVSLIMEEDEGVDLLQWVIDNKVNQAVVDPTDPISPSHSDLLALLKISLHVSNYSNFVEKLHQKIPSGHIDSQWVIECQDEHAILYKSAV